MMTILILDNSVLNAHREAQENYNVIDLTYKQI